MTGLPVIVIGAGGHARVVIDVLRQTGFEILGVAVADRAKATVDLPGLEIVGSDQDILSRDPSRVALANGIGSTGRPGLRRDIYRRYTEKGFGFVTTSHPSAIVAADAEIGAGTQLMAGAIVQPGVRIGVNGIINTGATIDHDCAIGDHVHVAPGVTLSGNVAVGESTHIGIGATVIQNINIGPNCMIKAGAVVTRDVIENTKVAGAPARRRRR